MRLNEIFSQDKAIRTLESAWHGGKIAHAYIFAGPEGVGKGTTAESWAQLLLCDEPIREEGFDYDFIDSCGFCKSCELFNAGSHPDFHPIRKELREFTKKGGNTPLDLPIDVIREFLIDKVSATPQQSKNKVFVVYEAQKLNKESQNALLKVLEEPAGNSFIILLCTRLDNLLPTTKSRCQIVRFGPIETAVIEANLVNEGINEVEAAYWAGFCCGSLGRAIRWASLESKPSPYEIKTELVAKFSRFDKTDVVDTAGWICDHRKVLSDALSEKYKDISKKDLERLVREELINMVVSVLNDSMRLAVGYEGGLVNSEQAGCISAVASRLDADECAERIEAAFRSIGAIGSNMNEKLLYERLLLNVAK